MKKCLYYLACLLILESCEDVLDKPDLSVINPDIWNKESTASMYLNRLYDRSMPGPGFGANAANSDESPGGTDAMYGRLSSSSVDNYDLGTYQRIRDINIAIEDIEKGTLPEETKGELMGQAYALRAWEYWDLVKLYGGVPMVLKPLDPFKDDLQMPRNPTAESIDLIVADLDSAIAGLPPGWDEAERGRITRGAAAAIKSRVLLFWASPQFNPDHDAARWERAYTASKEAKTILDEDGYGLLENFEDIFIEEGNKKVIFARLYDFTAEATHGWENDARPRVIGGDGGQEGNPTKSLVDAFPMANGLSIDDPASGYDETHYWKGRDPRFYATIVYNGAVYEVQGYPSGRRQWHYFYYDENGSLTSIEPAGPTTTGFYTRKAINPNIEQIQVGQTGTDWVEIRYAEVLLNLAEAANETGKTAEAYDILKTIRERAGIEAGADGLYGLQSGMSKEEMREAILLERQIEFAFENKRYWDLRRHNLFAEELNGTRRMGIRTVLKPEIDPEAFLAIRDQIDLDTEFEDYFTVEEWVLDEESAINYPQPQYNFFGIPSNILDRSPAVEQTKGWDGGTFDPLN